MPPRRKKDPHLPPCIYRKHGAYYLVKNNTWTRLGTTLSDALREYARRLEHPVSSVSDLLDRVLSDASARGLAPATLSQYQHAVNKLRPILVEFTPSEVKPHHIGQVMDHLRHTPNMANRCRSVLKMAFDLAVRTGLCDANPVISIPRHGEASRDRYLTDAEYLAIHGAASPTLRAIMDLAYLTAQRIGDVLAIREADIGDDGIGFVQDKTGKRLLIEWTPGLRAAVDQARALHTARPLILLAQRNGKPRSYRGVRDLWDRACTLANVADAHLHDLRAKSLTDAKRQGLNPTLLAGHSTEAQTTRYIRGKMVDLARGPSRVGGESS